jgi:hypothetical protein
MNAVFKACLLALLLLITFSPLAHADNLPAPLMSDPKFSFLTTLPTDNVVLMYNPGTITNISGLVTTTKAVHEDIDRFFDGYSYRTTVVVAGANTEFRLFVNVGDAPDAVKALNWNVGYNGLTVIKSPAMLSDFKQVLTHQLARIAVRTRQTFYKSLPEWYQDGVASYAAGDLTQDQRMAVSVNAATGGWMSLEGVERAYRNMTIFNYEQQEYREARAQAAALVDNIGSLYGSGTLVAIIDDYTESGNLTYAFVNRTTFTPDALNSAFRSSLSGNTNNNYNNSSVSKPVNGTIEGFLRYADGKPAAEATLMLSGKGGTSNATTDTDGHYAIAVAPGTYQVIVPGWTTGSQVTAEAGKRVSQNLTLVPPPVKDNTRSWPSTDDIILYGSIAVVNAVGIIAVLIILRRNWH